MKKSILRFATVAMVAMAMLVTSCGKDHHGGGGGGYDDFGTATGKHIVQETAYGTDGQIIITR